MKRQPLNEYFTEFEKDVLISTWEALMLYTNEHGTLIFQLAAEMCPELKTAYNVEYVYSFCVSKRLVLVRLELMQQQKYHNLLSKRLK